MSCNEYEEFVLKRGINLESIGINAFIFNFNDTLSAIDILERIQLPILGGDVYAKIDNDYELTYDNWYIEGNEGISSYKKSKEYVYLFEIDKNSVFFSLVISDKGIILPLTF